MYNKRVGTIPTSTVTIEVTKMSDKLKKCKTPKGELRWVTHHGEGKEDLSGRMQYVASILLDDRVEAHKAFIDSINTYFHENKPKHIDAPKSTGIYPLYTKDDDGNKVRVEHMFYATFKTNTKFADGSPKKVKIYNAKAVEVDLGNQSIGNGSVGRISGAMDMYDVKSPKGQIMQAGVTLYLDGIMLTKFEAWTGSDAFDDDDVDDDADGWTGADEESGFEPEPTEAKAKPRI